MDQSKSSLPSTRPIIITVYLNSINHIISAVL
jgi:hypothetical protein